ncbi:MAG: efflux RND transporter permease subunit [Planctomycetes bacterium]|nr:efflux RND transporter permease subunit [Planctomycetota bacterium]
MLNFMVTWSLNHRLAVIVLSLVCVGFGTMALSRLDIDAFPDTTPVQVQINTTAPALTPEEVERQITAPIEQAVGGVPKLEQMRSISKFGLSQVVIVFGDGTDIYFARQVVSERLSTVELPEGIRRPDLGPVATGLGEVFHYLVTSDTGDKTAARTAQDWIIKPALRAVPGVAEVNGWGGFEKQYQVEVDPNRLIAYRLTLDQVLDAIRAGNMNVGGGVVPLGGDVLLVQGSARVGTIDEIGAIVVSAKDGVAVRVADVATVSIGHEVRRGAVTADGKGEAVLGLGFMLMGENSHRVTHRLKTKLAEVAPYLPPGVHVQVLYDRTELVDHVMDTVRANLCEGGLLVVSVLFIFLGSLRAGLIVALAIPFSMLVAFDGMLRFGIAASLLSLGALDFGMVVDSSVIVIENAVRRLADPKEAGRDRLSIVRDATIQVLRPALFGALIVVMVYLPILTLSGVEGKMFIPMALTVVFALTGAMILSLTLMPVLASFVLRPKAEERPPFIARACAWLYAPALRWALSHRLAVVIGSLALTSAAIIVFRGIGSEFVPRLSEGALAVNVIRHAGTGLETSAQVNTKMERLLLTEFPNEISHVWSRIGTAEVATDPMGIELTDVFMSLTPRDTWKKAHNQTELAEAIQQALRDVPGQRNAMTQPIEMRLNEMVSGVKSDVAIKLFGDDFDTLVAKAGEIETELYGVTGATDITTEQVTGQPVLRVHADQAQLARHGIPARDVMELVQAIAGISVGQVTEGQLRFPLVARLPKAIRSDIAALATVPVLTATGSRVPLGEVATITQVEAPSTINREWGQRRITIQCNVRGRDVASFVADAQRAISQRVILPPGRYRIEWGGQFENLEHAQTQLIMVVPLALAAILALLRVALGSFPLALLVATAIPVSVTGGVAALWLRGMPFSISAAVGFIALAGVAVLNGLVMVTFISQLRQEGALLADAVMQGSLTRLRPVLMTALVAAVGFLPMAMADGMGAEVQRPLATVVIGGIVSSTLLTLFLVPVLYGWFEPKRLRADGTTPPSPDLNPQASG